MYKLYEWHFFKICLYVSKHPFDTNNKLLEIMPTYYADDYALLVIKEQNLIHK